MNKAIDLSRENTSQALRRGILFFIKLGRTYPWIASEIARRTGAACSHHLVEKALDPAPKRPQRGGRSELAVGIKPTAESHFERTTVQELHDPLWSLEKIERLPGWGGVEDHPAAPITATTF